MIARAHDGDLNASRLWSSDLATCNILPLGAGITHPESPRMMTCSVSYIVSGMRCGRNGRGCRPAPRQSPMIRLAHEGRAMRGVIDIETTTDGGKWQETEWIESAYLEENLFPSGGHCG